MSIIDVVIIVVIILGGFAGYKRGFLPQLISLIGFFVVMVGAFLLKNPISELLYTYCPFFKFVGILKDVSVLNIILYEVVAVILTALILWLILKIVSILFNKINDSINDIFFFEVLSELGGCFLGLIENYIVVFVCLYITALPFFNIELLRNSTFRPFILKDTPILSSFVDESVKVFEELGDLTNKYRNEEDVSEFNKDALDVLLKYKFTSVSSIDKLVEKNKIEINGIEDVLSKYRK